jgi:hypothetical protein
MADDRLPITPEEGPCAICHERPAEYLDLVCWVCKDAIDANEPWTLAYEDVVFRLREAEAEADAEAGIEAPSE